MPNPITHLQEFYGLTASRISQYSPGDTTKGNERQINRRPNVRFNPKATLEIIARGPPKDELGEEERRELVTKYLQFKELMNKIDEDDEEDAEGVAEGGKENPRCVSLVMAAAYLADHLKKPT